MAAPTPARLYCTLVGAVLVIVGIVGFAYSSGFDTGTSAVAADADDAFGLLAVNGWLNLLHLALGLLALAAAGGGARTYALAAGLLYVALAIWGLADGDGVIAGLLPLDDEDNILHLVLGLAGLAAGAATPATRPAGASEARAAAGRR